MVGAGFAFAVLLVLSGAALAHDTRHVLVDAEGAVAVELYYTDTTLMRFAAIQVFAPDDPDQPFLFGRSDDNGRFAFLPDRPGVWRLRAEGEDGHVHTADIEVGAAATVPSQRLSGWPRLLLWASLTLNLFLAALWLKGRKRADAPGTQPQ